ARFRAACDHRDSSTIRELYRVRQQVEQYLTHLRPVRVEGRALDADVDNELQRFFPYHRLDLLRDLGNHVAKLDVLEMQRHLAGFDLRQVEDVVDQREEMLCRGAAASQRVALAVVDVTED